MFVVLRLCWRGGRDFKGDPIRLDETSFCSMALICEWKVRRFKCWCHRRPTMQRRPMDVKSVEAPCPPVGVVVRSWRGASSGVILII
ncbi:hypothetical protein TNCV_2119381 [Trichonephila clavipes]|nr:hypothetical protein TNCV_2119381 [Trichonephila clavipes]